MKYKLIKIPQLSGRQASIYTVVLQEDENSLFEQFLSENNVEHSEEVSSIVARLKLIGTENGARDNYFKHHEGKPGDLVCALYDDPDAKLRLYCIRYGKSLVLLGGGGEKPDEIRTWQQDPTLSKHANEMINISKDIDQRMKDKDIGFSFDYMDFLGELDFTEDEQE